MSDEPRHCDDYIDDTEAHPALRAFLAVERLPAVDKHDEYAKGNRPKLFATYNGERWRVVMASRLGDVGLTRRLKDEIGYSLRLFVEDLSNFGDTP